MTRPGWILTFVGIGSVLLAGLVAAAVVWWPAALILGTYLVYAGGYLHPRRLCHFCRHEGCPMRSIPAIAPRETPGFTGWERPFFYVGFPAAVAVLLTFGFVWWLPLGAAMVVVLVASLAAYYRKVCRACEMPCPLATSR